MMNTVVRSALRISTMRSFNPIGRRDFARTFWHMSKPEIVPGASKILQNPSLGCSCGCGSKHLHTKGEQELVEFLKTEIGSEKDLQKGKTIPTEIDGFKVTLNGADVELTKQTEKEKIQISFNINHTVDTNGDDAEDYDTSNNAFSPMDEMKSTPNFEVDIIKGGTTLSFTCSFLKGVPSEGEYDDVFGIDEFTMFAGEWTEKNYAVAGDVLDGHFYDLLMNMLEEKGISNKFVTKLSDLSTNYEHASYIGLLESLSKFTLGK